MAVLIIIIANTNTKKSARLLRNLQSPCFLVLENILLSIMALGATDKYVHHE